MASVMVNPPKTPVTKGSSGIASATVPNVCKMPGPPAPFVPTPLPNIGKSGMSPQGYSTTVTIEGEAVAIQGASFGSMGDVASKGTGGGIVSSNCEGPTKFIGPGSLDVKIEGKNVQYLGDPMMNNCGPSGSPPNAATMTGVMQASGAISVTYGDDEPCERPTTDDPDGPKCGKVHPVQPGKETHAAIHELLDALNALCEAQHTQIQRLSQVNARLSQVDLLHKKAMKTLTRIPNIAARAEEIATLEGEIAALEAEITSLKAERLGLNAFFAASAVLRWDPDKRTYGKGYMIGVAICNCGSKKLAACSSRAPPAFAAAVKTITYELASAPAVAPDHPDARPSSWECAAKQIMEKLAGHKPVQLIESPFLPAIPGLAASKGPTIEIQVTMLDGSLKPVEKEYKTGEETPSCDKCQAHLSAIYCKNECG